MSDISTGNPLQRTPEWFKDRSGCLTASRAAAVLNRRKDGKPTAAYAELIDTLVCERVTGDVQGIGTTAAMQWGTDHEDEAREAYEEMTGELVGLVGFVPHPEIEYFGASPDGLVGDDGLLEIKCPYSSAKHLQRGIAGTVPEEYRPQMLVQLICTGRRWVDFVSYDPRLFGKWERARLFVVRYEPTQEERDAALAECKEFLEKVRDAYDKLAAGMAAMSK